LIGEADHVMSPVGGVGINYAIQDAVVAANVLSEPLKVGKIRLRDLAEVQRQRAWPTRIIQAFQNFLQRRVVTNVVNSDKPLKVSPLLCFLLKLPLVGSFTARLISFGPSLVNVKEL